MTETCMHQILCRNVTAVRERIERRLGVETDAWPLGHGDDRWAVTFGAPKDVDLDFLRPDVLPPKPRDYGEGCDCGAGNRSDVHRVGCAYQPWGR